MISASPNMLLANKDLSLRFEISQYNPDQRFSGRQHLPNFDSVHARSLQRSNQRISLFARYGKQQSACRLGIEQHGSDLGGDFALIAHQALRKIAVGIQAAGHKPGAYAIQCSFKKRDTSGMNLEA